MVKRFLQFIGKEVSGLHEAAYLLGIFSIASQLLALFRDRLLAYTFGATHSLDLYYAAFRIPDFIFATVSSLVSVSILIPFLMQRIEKNETEAKKFINAIFSGFFLIIGVTALISFFVTPFLLKLLFPSFAATSDFPTLVTMTRIMLFSPIFLGFSNFFASITQIYKRFFIYALSPIIYNIGIIVGIAVLYPWFGLAGLAWGVALGSLLHCAIQLPFVWKKSLFPRFTWKFNGEVAKVFLVSLPRTITVSSNEIAEFFLIAMAGSLAGGAISIFNFSWNLQSVPYSTIGVSYALAAFPVLTKFFNIGDTKRFVREVVESTKHIVFWCLPAMTLFIVLRAQIVRVILGAGQFNWSDTRLTAAALAIFTFSLIPQSMIGLFVRAYYSRGNTNKPLLMNVVSAVIIIAASYFFIIFFKTIPMFKYFIESMFRVDDIAGGEVLMLPLGFSFGVLINMIMHWISFEWDFPGYTRSITRSFFEIFSSSVIMGAVSYVLLNELSFVFNLNTTIGVFLQGFLAGIVGIGVAIALLILLGNKEIVAVHHAFRRRIFKTQVIPPDVSGV